MLVNVAGKIYCLECQVHIPAWLQGSRSVLLVGRIHQQLSFDMVGYPGAQCLPL